MKIARIDSHSIKVPYTFGGSHQGEGLRTWTTNNILLVRVETDTGIVGWGEAFCYACTDAVRAALHNMVGPLAIGQDARDIAKLSYDLQQKLHLFGRYGITIFALSGLDIALWDIAGKAAGLPVHRLLGGSDAVELRCYASLIRYTDPEVVAENVARALDQGFRHLKLHEIDPAAVGAARATAGDEVEITLDVNCPWSVREGLDMARRLRPFNLRWLEEPVWPPENYEGLAKMRRESGIPIAAGENASTLMDFGQMLRAEAVDFLQPSPAKMGGITELCKVFALANAHNTPVMVHTFYDGPGLLASVQASAALGSKDALIEWRYFDLEAQLYGDAIIPRNGAIAVPQGPGLGIEPNADVIRDYRRA